MLFVRQFLASDNPVAQFAKGIIGTASGVLAAVSPQLTDIEAYARAIGAVAAAFCSVAMAAGIIAGWVKARRKSK